MNNKIEAIGFPLYDKWLRNLRTGKTIECFFHDNFYSSIAIYGMGLIGMQIFEELRDSDIQVYYGIDQNAQEKGIEGLDVIFPECLKNQALKTDVIVITPMHYFYEIEKMLLELTERTQIVSIEQIVEYVSRHG